MRDNPFFNNNRFVLLPLHSQIPREDQFKVFADVQGDVDGFIAQYDPKTRKVPKIAAEIAQRLVEKQREADTRERRDHQRAEIGFIDLHHTRSITMAVPMPAPTQSVISAVVLSERSSSSTIVPRIMPPVAPSG